MSSIILAPVSVSVFRAAETSFPSVPQSDGYDDDSESDNDEDADEDDDQDDGHRPDGSSIHSAPIRSSAAIPTATITSTTTSQEFPLSTTSSLSTFSIALANPDQTQIQTPSHATSISTPPTVIPALETQASTSNPSTKAGIALANILGILTLASVVYFLFAFLPRRRHQRQQKQTNLSGSSGTDSLEKGVIQLNLEGTPNQDTGIVYGRGARTRGISFLARKWYSTGSQATQLQCANVDPPTPTPALQSPVRSARRSIRDIGAGIGLGLGRVTPLFTRRTMMMLQSRFSGTTATTATTATADTNTLSDEHRDAVADAGRELGTGTMRCSREVGVRSPKEGRNTLMIETDEIFDGQWEKHGEDDTAKVGRKDLQRTSLPSLPLPVFSPTRLEI